MLFLKLTVDNFGVFRGKHSFDLAPYFDGDDAHHLTIFSGHNGAGKTTLFQAMMLALHGSASLGDHLSIQEYHHFLQSRMHRPPDAMKVKAHNDFGVALSFQYVQSGQYSTIEVVRRWQKHGRSLQEALIVLQDGRSPDIDPADYQAWLNDFISPGFGSLCFFDAEQLDSLVNPEQQNRVLRQTLERLLGLDLVQRLQVDLEQVLSRLGSTARVDNLYTKVLELRSSVEELHDQLTELDKKLDEVGTDLSSCEAALAQLERRLAAEGGAYAAKRPLLQEQLATIKKDAETLANQLRDLCGDLLPFAFVPELCLELSKRLASEMEIRQQKALDKLWQEKLPSIRELLLGDGLWAGIEIAQESRQYLATRIIEKLSDMGDAQTAQDMAIVHHLSEPQQRQLRQWISQVLRSIPQQVQSIGGKLRELKEEQRRIETDLERAPDDAVLAPIHAEMKRLQEILSNKQRQQAQLNAQVGSIQFQYEEKRRALEKAVEQYEKASRVEKQLELAERSVLVARTYKDALTRQKLEALEEALTVCFNRICRKEHLLARVYINPDDFTMRLEGVDGNELSANNFSAGERQLYALALLWALRLVSRRGLPLAIDTPLARLDEIHRLRLLLDYVPKVSEQVMLFTTEAELDPNSLARTEPYMARIYRLNHDIRRGETVVECQGPNTAQELDLHSAGEEEVSVYGL
jgi:DNA sulfur modification protein DndD